MSGNFCKPDKMTYHFSVEYICLDCGRFLKGTVEITAKPNTDVRFPILTCRFCKSSADRVQRIG